MTEKQLIDAAQKAVATAKKALANVESAMEKVAKLNREAGRLQASNAAMRFQGACGKARNGVIMAHADASDALLLHYPDFAEEVITRGPGR